MADNTKEVFETVEEDYEFLDTVELDGETYFRLIPATDSRTSTLSTIPSRNAAAKSERTTPKKISPAKTGSIRKSDGSIQRFRISLIGSPVVMLSPKSKNSTYGKVELKDMISRTVRKNWLLKGFF